MSSSQSIPKLKVAFIVSNPKYIGGGSYIAFKYAEELAKKGHDVVVFADNYPKLYSNSTLPPNLKVYIRGSISLIPNNPLTLVISVFLRAIDELYRIIYDITIVPKIIKKEGIMVIVGFPTLDGIRSLKISKRCRVKLVTFGYESPLWVKERKISQISSTLQRIVYSIKFTFRYIFDWEPMKRAVLHSDELVVISHLAKVDFQKWLGKSGHVIHPGVDTDFVDSIPNMREEYQIIYVGRLFSNKNVDKIIVALSRIKNHPKFIIIGSGPQKQALKKLAKELNVRCEFKGTVTDAKKWMEIKRSMFMVTATSFEGSADVPAEALYCKKPCIVSDIPIMKADYGKSVEYFRENNVTDLAKAITFLIDNPKYRRKKGKLGKKFVENNYTLKIACTKLERILRRLINTDTNGGK